MKKGKKYDNGKPDLVGLLSAPEDVLYALDAIGQVIVYGRKKYGGDNWSQVPNAMHRYKAAALRHIAAVCRGELLDKESLLKHLAHAGASVLFVLAMQLEIERGQLRKATRTRKNPGNRREAGASKGGDKGKRSRGGRVRKGG